MDLSTYLGPFTVDPLHKVLVCKLCEEVVPFQRLWVDRHLANKRHPTSDSKEIWESLVTLPAFRNANRSDGRATAPSIFVAKPDGVSKWTKQLRERLSTMDDVVVPAIKFVKHEDGLYCRYVRRSDKQLCGLGFLKESEYSDHVLRDHKLLLEEQVPGRQCALQSYGPSARWDRYKKVYFPIHFAAEEKPEDEEDDESVVGSDVVWLSVRDGEVGMSEAGYGKCGDDLSRLGRWEDVRESSNKARSGALESISAASGGLRVGVMSGNEARSGALELGLCASGEQMVDDMGGIEARFGVLGSNLVGSGGLMYGVMGGSEARSGVLLPSLSGSTFNAEGVIGVAEARSGGSIVGADELARNDGSNLFGGGGGPVVNDWVSTMSGSGELAGYEDVVEQAQSRCVGAVLDGFGECVGCGRIRANGGVGSVEVGSCHYRTGEWVADVTGMDEDYRME